MIMSAAVVVRGGSKRREELGRLWRPAREREKKKKKKKNSLKRAEIRQINAENDYKSYKHRNAVGQLKISTRSDRELQLHK